MLRYVAFGLVVLLIGCGSDQNPSPEDEVSNYSISTEVGAGGSGVKCGATHGGKPYFEVLDVYEARKRGMGPDLGGPEVSVAAKIEIALGRLARFSPLRADRYRKRIKTILDEKNFFRRGYLPHIGDDDPADLPAGCHLVQIATRRKPLFENDPEFLIDQNLVNQLDNDNVAVLALHEAAYDEAGNDFGHTTSRMSRGFISIFFSRNIENMSRRGFMEFLARAEYKTTDYGGLQIPTKIFTDDGVIAATRMEGDRIVSARWAAWEMDGRPTSRSIPYFGSRLITQGIFQQAVFSPTGRILALGGTIVSGEAPIEDRGNKLIVGPARKESLSTFDAQGRLEIVSVVAGSELKLKGETNRKLIEQIACVRLDASGYAEIIGVDRPCAISDTDQPFAQYWN